MQVVLVCAADDCFAMPLAVTLVSVLSTLDISSQPLVYVLDGGISKKNAAKIQRCLLQTRCDTVIHWVAPDFDQLRHLKASKFISLSTYLRLQIADLLPSSVSRAIYLDCDLIILKDLTALWTIPLVEHSCGVARDYAFPVVSAAEAIEHWSDLGLDPQTPYFNAGVMLINLDLWREEATGQRVISYLSEMGDRNNLGDQGGLNAILAGKVILIDPRWNTTLSSLSMYDESAHGISVDVVRSDPWIIHFTSRWKPWHLGVSLEAQTTFYYNKVARDLFFDFYFRTRWRNPFVSHAWVFSRKVFAFTAFALPRRLGLLNR